MAKMSDIFTALKPLVYVSAILGLGPFVVDEKEKLLKATNWGIGYNILVLVLFTAFATYSLYEKISRFFNGSLMEIRQYVFLAFLACGVIVAWCSLLMIVIHRANISAMVDKFRGVDFQMARLDVRMPYERVTHYTLATIVSLVIILILLLIHDYFLGGDPGSIFDWVTYGGPIVLGSFMECQFVLGGLLLRKNFLFLNERLTKFGTEEIDTVSGERKFEVIDGGFDGYIDAHLIRNNHDKVMPAWEGNFSKYRIRKVAPADGLIPLETSSLAKIKTIRKVHSNLCEIKELLNSSYSLELLASVAQAFVIITSNLYTLFTSSGKTKQRFSISYPIVWVIYRSMELICITVTCTKISKTANHTAVIVHKLLAQDWEPTIRNQLKLFSIQLLHRKISFSACGFFTLDMTLLHAIIGAATTYLVILIQFHNTYECP